MKDTFLRRRVFLSDVNGRKWKYNIEDDNVTRIELKRLPV